MIKIAQEEKDRELGEVVRTVIERWKWTPDQIRDYAARFVADRGPAMSILLDIADVREAQQK